ncbi:AAA family ATPase [Propionimicrobium lymphophilum]|uniref:ATP-dependent nuclease n=1 Tax=Propionimicrobium lymphophilum TaxID=33012 RepID=UPI0025508D7B|nr:AAA family ATPase [Propionimicrobium lymphophilum]MDK7710585.1 AAA family ATPase [Propionimicrobium lymphophilum]MDK7733829.1 AAA family ATPase [Propionimicrobium lymphophilum]
MKLTRIKVENHKRLADLDIEVRDHLVLVGANDVGKSSLLRCLDLLLGASTAQLYSRISSEDFRDSDQPFVIEGTLTKFSDADKALYPDEIHIDPNTNSSRLVVRLVATVDENETVSINRIAPEGGTGRQLSRDQVLGLGWKFLSATTQIRDLQGGRKSTLDDILQAIDLGDEKATFEDITANLEEALCNSKVLKDLRDSISEQLSKALPDKVAQDDLAFVPGAAAENDVLSDVRLQVSKHGESHDLSEQSDGTRALYAIALYDLMSVGANMVGIDEPEIHLHPSSQRSLARLLKEGENQKIIATHSANIVGTFDPDSIVVIREGGKAVQPKAGFLSGDERTAVRLWVRNLIEALTARRVIAVEGISDRIILEHIANLTDRNLDRLGVSLIEAGGVGNMDAFEKLFGKNGFRIPLSVLIDADAEDRVAKSLGVKVEDLKRRSVSVSQRDLEDEYVRALGPEAVWKAIEEKNLFSDNVLKNCKATGPGGSRTEDDVAGFCRNKALYKVNAALSVLNLFTPTNARNMSSIENLLSEIGE